MEKKGLSSELTLPREQKVRQTGMESSGESLPLVMALRRYVEALTPCPSGYDLIQKQGHFRVT